MLAVPFVYLPMTQTYTELFHLKLIMTYYKRMLPPSVSGVKIGYLSSISTVKCKTVQFGKQNFNQGVFQ